MNATLFYTKVADVQVPTLIMPDGVVVTRDTGNLTSKGFEIEFRAILKAGLNLEYNFGLTGAKYEDLITAQDGSAINLQDNKQIFTPEVTSLLALQYKTSLGLGKDWRFLVRAEWKYLGEQYFDLANSLRQSPYSLYNGSLGLQFRNLDLTIWTRNIFDKRYVSYGYNFGAVHLGSPATFGLTISFDI